MLSLGAKEFGRSGRQARLRFSETRGLVATQPDRRRESRQQVVGAYHETHSVTLRFPFAYSSSPADRGTMHRE